MACLPNHMVSFMAQVWAAKWRCGAYCRSTWHRSSCGKYVPCGFCLLIAYCITKSTKGNSLVPRPRQANKGSGNNTTCYLTFEGRDHDDVLSKFQAI